MVASACATLCAVAPAREQSPPKPLQSPHQQESLARRGACGEFPPAEALLLRVPAAQRTVFERSAERALARVADCEQDADFLAQLGALLNSLGRHEEALEHLERALLLRPDEPLARLGYAWALLELGERSAALELLEDMSIWAAPARLREPLARQRQALLTQAGASVVAAVAAARPAPGARSASALHHQEQTFNGSTWRLQHQWQVIAGRETNLLGAPGARSLTLTFTGLPGGETVLVSVPLDPAFQPQAGSYTQYAGVLRAQGESPVRPNGGVPAVGEVRLQWDALASLRHRQTSNRAGFTQADAALDLLWRSRPGPLAPLGQEPTSAAPSPAPKGAWPDAYVTAGATALESQNGVRYASASLAGGWQVPLEGACDLRLGADTQDRRYWRNPVLNGRYAGAQAALRCSPVGSWPLLGAAPGLSLQARVGADKPDSTDRPGGQQRQWTWRAAAAGPRGFLEIEQARQADQLAYSPLIEAGAQRRQQRWSARAEWVQALNHGGLQAFAGLEANRQKSNIVLFDSRNTGVYLGMRGVK